MSEAKHAVFWLIWCERGGSPTRKHPTRQSAMEEAERLARANPERTFHVLESYRSVTVRSPVEWSVATDPDDMPF